MRIIYLCLFIISSFAPKAFARHSYSSYACGSRVVFDCDHHVATMGSLTSPLDCGKDTPMHRNGRVQGKRTLAGTHWRCLKGAPAADIGLGQIYVHAPCGGRRPVGHNQHFKHSGCMNVTAQMRDAIRNCAGAPFEIKYASKNGSDDWGSRYAARRVRHPHYYAQRDTDPPRHYYYQYAEAIMPGASW